MSGYVEIHIDWHWRIDTVVSAFPLKCVFLLCWTLKRFTSKCSPPSVDVLMNWGHDSQDRQNEQIHHSSSTGPPTSPCDCGQKYTENWGYHSTDWFKGKSWPQTLGCLPFYGLRGLLQNVFTSDSGNHCCLFTNNDKTDLVLMYMYIHHMNVHTSVFLDLSVFSYLEVS